MAKDWRLQLALVLAAALLLRVKFFVGFGLGDDLGYIGYADKILAGSYPALDLLNQYAYRPLLLYLFAAGIAIFGHTDLGVVAPVLLASLVTTALVFIFVRKLIDPAAAVWCGLLFAFEPFNVVNSTTMTNDVILACLVFASIGAFVLADRETPSRSRGLFTLSAALMLAAFLVKIACAPAIGAIALYSMVALRQRPTDVVKRHSFFYVSLLLGLFAVCLGYYFKKGDLFWQIKAETFYYETYKPALAVRISVVSVLGSWLVVLACAASRDSRHEERKRLVETSGGNVGDRVSVLPVLSSVPVPAILAAGAPGAIPRNADPGLHGRGGMGPSLAFPASPQHSRGGSRLRFG